VLRSYFSTRPVYPHPVVNDAFSDSPADVELSLTFVKEPFLGSLPGGV